MSYHGRPASPLLRKPIRFIERIASVPVLLALLILSLLFPVVLFPVHGIGDVRVLDLHFSYSPDQVHEHLAALGAEGRRGYAAMASTSDLLFPIVYSTALSVALMLILRRDLPQTARFLCLFPFLIVIADWIENFGLLKATRAFPDRAETIVRYASFFTSLKWTLIISTLLMLLAAAAASLIVRRIRSRR